MTGWQIDDQPLDLAFPHRGELGGDDLEVPAHRQLGLRVEVVETACGEQRKVVALRGVVLGARQPLNHRIRSSYRSAESSGVR